MAAPATTLEQAVFGGAAKVLGADLYSAASAAADSDGDDAAAAAGPAWVDDDDAGLSVDVVSKPRARKLRADEAEKALKGNVYAGRLKTQFEKVHGRPMWADAAEAVDEDGQPGVLATTGKLLGSSVDRLPQGKLQCVRVRDANHAAVSQAVVQATKFHPGASVMMTAGLDKTLRLFQVDGKENALLQSVHISDLPIISAHFCQGGNEIVMSGRRKFFYTYDLQEGKVRKIHEIQGRKERSLENMFVSPDSKYVVFTGESGSLIMVSNKTKQWVNTLKMNGSARAVTFMDDGQKMLTSGSDGKVYVWDLRMNKCMHVFTDEGCVKSTSLAVSANGDYIACGSDSGVVNVYDQSCLTKTSPKPIKAVMNLTTEISHLEFHPKSQILGMASRNKKESFRMVHLPSTTVFSNWPTAGTPLGYVNSFGFSPGGGYTAIGNDKGKVLLYRVSHYPEM